MRHLFRVENIDRCDSNWPLGTKMCNFCMVIAIFVNRAYHQYAWGYNFPIRVTPKKMCVSELSGLTPVFGRFGLVSVHKLRD